ncbi:hypothetical protein JCM10212_002767 [Sporobolomyces blumeae]
MDPTNANAVPGSSRHPYGSTPSDSATQASTGLAPPPPPTLPRVDPSASASTTTSKPTAATTPAPRRRADGPVIVPTVVAQDGVRQVPQLFEHCQVEDLIALIASMLDRLIEHNDRIPLTPTSLTRFHSRAPPSIGVRDYLLRIARYTNVEPCCLLILLPYVDKVCARMNTFTISSLTVHRFIIAAVSVGSKALSDAFCTNGRYARVGGVSVVEMNLLEKEFCEAIDWRLTTSGAVLAHYYTSLVRSHPSYRLSTAPIPDPGPSVPLAPEASQTSSISSSSAPPPPPAPASHASSSTSPVASSSSSSISASSSSMSIDPSPALSSTSMNGTAPPPSSAASRARPPPSRPSSSSSSSAAAASHASPRPPSLPSPGPSKPPLPFPTSMTEEARFQATSTPPLVPPNLSRRFVSASNLPSPAPRPSPSTFPVLPPSSSSATSSSPRRPPPPPPPPPPQSSTPATPELEGSMLPPRSPAYSTTASGTPYVASSPAKRGRRRSTSSNASSPGGSSSSNPPVSREGGGCEHPSASVNGHARFDRRDLNGLGCSGPAPRDGSASSTSSLSGTGPSGSTTVAGPGGSIAGATVPPTRVQQPPGTAPGQGVGGRARFSPSPRLSAETRF